MISPVRTLNENTLHKDLKWLYSESNDQLERRIGNFIVDVVKDDHLIEIQTRNFSAIRKKLNILLQNNKVKLVYPIIQEKWIVKLDTQLNKIIGRRLSPVHCSYINIFKELINIPNLVSLLVTMIIIQILRFFKNIIEFHVFIVI